MRHLTREDLTELAARYHVEACAIEDVSTDEGAVDFVITDPPYADRTQSNTRKGKQTKHDISTPMPLGFDAATEAKRARWAQTISRSARKAALVFSDHESSMDWANHLERAGMEYMRTALWIRTGDEELTADRPVHSGAPQFTGDRPAQGHECIVIAYQRGSHMRWLGKGRAAIYTAPVVPSSQRLHSTQKPLSLMSDVLRDFVRPGETIADLFCGSGTTLVAAKLHGCGAFGVELDRKHAATAARRAAAASPT